MKLTLLCFLLLILGGITYYNFRPEKPEFPLMRNIVNGEGKSLEVALVGKEGDTIHFNRYSDKKRFSVPISSLSEEDQIFISKLPEQRPPREKIKVAKVEKTVPLYIQNREERIEQVKEEISLLRKQAKADSLASISEKNTKQKIKELYSEIKALELAIEQYKANNWE